MITATTDMSYFDQVLEKYLDVTSRTLRDVAISKAFFIAKEAKKFTPRGNSEPIKNLPLTLGRVDSGSKNGHSKWYGYVVNRIKKGGKAIGAQKTYKNGSVEGWNNYVGRVSKSILSKRKASIGWMAAGWNNVLVKLHPLSKDRFAYASDYDGLESTFKGRRTFGYVVIQDILYNIGILAVNRHARNQRGKTKGDAALSKAIQKETASMIEYLEERGHHNFTQAGIKQI